jgi:archaellum component FlaC
MEKKITINTLARMTQDQFSKIDERFDAVDVRFDKVDERLDKMDTTLKTILDVVLEIPSKKAFGRLEDKVQTIDTRLASVERKVRDKKLII